MKITKLLTAAALLSASLSGYSQADLQNNGIVMISSGTDILYVNGNVVNASGAALTNSGNLYVTQNLTNGQVSMPIGTGTLNLTGTAQQIVGGTQPFRTFNLSTDNTSGILLNNNLDVSGAHTFVNGIISSSATPNYLIYESGASYSGDGDSKHMSGWVKKFGATDFLFPVGNGFVERPVQLTSLSGSSEFNVHHYQNTPNTGNVQSPLLQIDPHEFWQINKISGGSANVAKNWNNAKIDMPEYFLATIKASYYTGGLWTDVGGSATGDVQTTGNITSNSVSSFGQFTFGSTSLLTLPLNFLNITASRLSTYTLVEWKTTNEVNVDHFEIERSIDGRSFALAGTIPSQKQSGILKYSFPDNAQLTGKIWYRVKSVDTDGRFAYTKIVLVSDAIASGKRFILVNPVRSQIAITVKENITGTYEYLLSSEGGQTLQTGTIVFYGKGNYQIRMKGSVRPGMYILTLSNREFVQNEKLRVL
ncbi:MAG: hypothetical protein ABI687_07355 [Flavitalea sp.]